MKTSDPDWVVLMNKMMITFLAVLTVGMLGLGTGVSATFYGVLHDDSGIVIGPGVVPATVGPVNGMKVITEETYNGGMSIVAPEKLKVTVIMSPVAGPPTSLNSAEVCPILDGVLQTCQPLSGEFNDFITYTDPGVYNVKLRGKLGASNYHIVIERLAS